ncbi:MAG: YbhB/YbcL family Raf kinase inhibitor-like protein [Nocardioidaceae bacterium]|nr:MAG: YbhB/YbcL family Raf kinase inhibitor-like protein [Nocardioidaceae bacterium]
MANLDRPRAEDPYLKLPAIPSFELTSTDIEDGRPMPARHAAVGACEGALNLSPQLAWSGFPEDTKSFVLTCFDPDAPTPSGIWHWVVADIPADITSLDTGAELPPGAMPLASDIGLTTYAGPWPADGDMAHRYYFVVHAIPEETLGVQAETRAALVAENCFMKATARAQIVATFQR